MGNIKVVLNRKAFKEQILHNATLLNDVQEQMEGMAEVHRAITVYRNDDRDTGNVVATAPARVEAEHGVLTQMLGMVRV
jgi:hypothetical protein